MARTRNVSAASRSVQPELRATGLHVSPEEQCLLLLRDHRSLTASAIASRTDLSRPTIDSALRSLETAKVVSSDLRPTGKAGRPGRTYTFVPSDRMVGVDIGQHAIRAIATDRAGRILARYEADRVREPSRDTFLRDLDDVVRIVGEGASIAGIGLAVPGIVKAQKVKLSRVLPYLNDWDFHREIESLINVPLFVSNDVKAAALGEARLGAGTVDSSQVTVWLGRRVSSAVTFNGELFEGANGVAGEMTTAVGTQWTPGSVCGDWQWPCGRSPLQTAERAHAGDAECLASLHDYLKALADPLSRLVAILDPEVLVLAGALSETSAPLVDFLATYLKERLTVPFLPRIRRSVHGRYSTAVGALYTAFTNPSAPALAHWQLPAPTTLTENDPATEQADHPSHALAS